MMKEFVLYDVNLKLFDGMPSETNLNVNKTTDTSATTGNDLSAGMKVFYQTELIRLAEAELVHDQFGEKKPIPSHNGKSIEFRRYDSLPKITTPLEEGVTPKGQKMNSSKIEAVVKQFGGYVGESDVRTVTDIDQAISEDTRAIASQAGRSIDTIVREIINGGTNVQYVGGVNSRSDLTGGAASGNSYLTVDEIKKAVRDLKRVNARKINGNYVAIIHPDVLHDLMKDPEWVNVKTYSDPEGIYRGEVGMLYGVRFVETSEAKIWDKDSVGGAGKSNRAVYSTLVIAEGAYATSEIEGLGLQHIYKPLGSGEDPLNQRCTIGWKATMTAIRLVEQYMIRIESTASFEDAEAN